MSRPWDNPNEVKKPQKKTIEGILKNTHANREMEITDVLRATRKPEDYIRRMDREDKRYYAVTEAIKEYYKTIEELKGNMDENQTANHTNQAPPMICMASLDITILLDSKEDNGIYIPNNAMVCIGSDGSVYCKKWNDDVRNKQSENIYYQGNFHTWNDFRQSISAHLAPMIEKWLDEKGIIIKAIQK
jgi:hypothetical protein